MLMNFNLKNKNFLKIIFKIPRVGIPKVRFLGRNMVQPEWRIASWEGRGNQAFVTAVRGDWNPAKLLEIITDISMHETDNLIRRSTPALQMISV